MLELVKYIAASLVDKPEAVDVREVENEESIVIELRVDGRPTPLLIPLTILG